MKVLGIIAEYNPFHNGHAYHIAKSKAITNSDYVVVIMSGSFTQSGNIAIYDKFSRANIAVSYGADLVIELPTIYANSSSEYFAYGAINLLNNLNIIDFLSFGSESNDIGILNNISNKLCENEKYIWDDIKKELKKGTSFAKSRLNALTSFLTSDEISISSLSNNILAIQYLSTINKLSSNIKPILIKRLSSNFNDTTLNNSFFTSATSIRNAIINNELLTIKHYVPSETLTLINSKTPLDNSYLYDMLKYKILCLSKDKLKNINEVCEGLENKLFDAISNSLNYDDFIMNLKSKRYQLSKIKRLIVNILLNITKTDFNLFNNSNLTYAHVIACNSKGKYLLSQISKKSDILLITSINKTNIDNLKISKSLDLDILATNIYATLNNEHLNQDFTNRLNFKKQ
ncbi:MAG: nucleotidyltransferase [Clostridia bacterium]